MHRAAVLVATVLVLAGCGGNTEGDTYIITPNSCTGLLGAGITDVIVDSARIIEAADGYPQHCRVEARTRSGRVTLEVRSPMRGSWNGRLLVQGTGGYSGQLDPALGHYRTPLAPGLLASNYAIATTDTGHRGNQQFETYYLPMLDGSWALDNPEGEQDFAWRGAAAATQAAQLLLARQHERAMFRTYWLGCSGAGRLGMKLAEQADSLFDGFIVGGPPLSFSREMARAHWNIRTAQALPLPPAKLRLLSRTVMERCDALDGAADGVVSDPERCNVNPFELRCTGADAADCLTENEAVAAFRYYQGPVTEAGEAFAPGMPATGAEDCGGLCDGAEDGTQRFREGWGWWFAGGPPSSLDGAGTIPLTPDRSFGSVLMTQFFRFMSQPTDQPTLRWFEFDPVNDSSFMGATAQQLDVQRTDFSAFRTSGKRILMYSGWADALVSPLAVTGYQRRVEAASGGRDATREVFRLFMAPGMQHCEGGKALDDFDAVGAMVRWVEEGAAPATLRSRNRWSTAFPGRERDLCVYPEVPTYRGSGSFDSADSFECRLPAGS